MTSTPQPHGILTEKELLTAHMEDCHKELALTHLRRLNATLVKANKSGKRFYQRGLATREQLARVTLVVRSYAAHQSHGAGEANADVESMIQDVVDASYYISGRKSTFSQPVFTDPFMHGRDQEVAALMQELLVGGNVDDVIELWNVPQPSNTVLPDTHRGNDVGKEVDWPVLLGRSKSEDDITHHFKHVKIANQKRWEGKLYKRKESRVKVTWPPSPSEWAAIRAGRSRSATDVSMAGYGELGRQALGLVDEVISFGKQDCVEAA